MSHLGRARGTFAGRTVLMSGGSRGIGLAIACRLAEDGANVALLAKTATPDPRLSGTVFTAAEVVERAGGTALPIVGDVRAEADVTGAVARRTDGPSSEGSSSACSPGRSLAVEVGH